MSSSVVSRHRPTPRLRSALQYAVLPAALLASGAMVLQGSNAAFSATTANPNNSWAAGQVVLTDDDGGTTPTTGTAMFTATALKPGSTGTKCIQVSSTSTVESTLKLYTSAVTTTNALSSNLNLTIEQGSGATFASCTGFTPAATGANVFTGTLASLGTSATGFATGVGTSTLTGTSQTRSYRFTYTVDTNAPNTTQNGTAVATFVWEAQSTS